MPEAQELKEISQAEILWKIRNEKPVEPQL